MSEKSPIEVFDSLLELLVSLNHAYGQLLEILTQEYRAAEDYDIDRIESLVLRKTEIAARVQTLSHQLLAYSVYLVGDRSDLVEPASLTDIARLVEEFVDREGDGQLRSRAQRVLSAIESFRDYADGCRVEIERNKTIISRLIDNHQESFAFWQNVWAELAGSYNQHGVVKDAVVNSIEVKA